MQNLKGIVLTDTNLRRLKEFDLYPDLADDESAMLKRLRRDIDVKIVTTPILDPRTGREREVVDAFTLSYDNRVPAKAQKGAQWLVGAFLAEHRRQRQGRASNAAEFYAKEAERVRTHVAQLESKLADFKRANAGQLPELTEVNMSMMDRTESALAANDMQARSLRQERVFLAAQLEQQRAQGPDSGSVRQLEDQYSRMRSSYDESHPDMIALRRQIDSLKYGTSAGAGTSLRSQLAAKKSTLAEARQRYGEEYPDVKKLQRDIATLETRIKSGERGDVEMADGTAVGMQLRTQINAIDSQLASLAAQNAELRAKMSGLERNVTAAPQVEREYSNATRDLTIAREKYEQLLNRQMDAEVSEAAIVGGRVDEFRLIQSPMLPGGPVEAAASRDPADRPGRRGRAGVDRDGRRRGARSEGARRARRARPARRVAAGGDPDDPQFALPAAKRMAVRGGERQRRDRRVDRIHRHQEFHLIALKRENIHEYDLR